MDSRDSRQAVEDLARQKGGLPSGVTESTAYKITRKEPCKLLGVPEHRHSAKLQSGRRTAPNLQASALSLPSVWAVSEDTRIHRKRP